MANELLIASDHAGYDLKEALKKFMLEQGLKVSDLGCDSPESVNYPSYAHQVAEKVQKEHSRGILICGSGIGMSITANRHPGVRAALCMSVELAKLSREHNDSNILVLGARFVDIKLAEEILDIWLKTPFAAGRHQTRLEQIDKY
mgnify:CR=1 FL=1